MVPHIIGSLPSLHSGREQAGRHSLRSIVYDDEITNRSSFPALHSRLNLVNTIPTHSRNQAADFQETVFSVYFRCTQSMVLCALLFNQPSALKNETNAATDTESWISLECGENFLEEVLLKKNVAIQLYKVI